MPASDGAPVVGYPAGLGRRLGALLYDCLLIFALWLVLLAVLVGVMGGETVPAWLARIALVGAPVGFFLLSWSRRGQTLGMAAWRLRLVDMQGRKPSMRQLLIRIAVAPFSLVAFGLGYVWLYIDHEQRTWHDRASSTLIVHLPKTD